MLNQLTVLEFKIKEQLIGSFPSATFPLPATTVENIAAKLVGQKLNRLFDAFHGVIEEANIRVQASAKRYLDALNRVLFST